MVVGKENSKALPPSQVGELQEGAAAGFRGRPFFWF